jgi:3-oxoacyl-[acyl-carrier protein] reductase
MTEQNMNELAGKVALVTGAASGMGESISMVFAAAGAAVCCADIQADGAAATASAIVDAGGRAIGEHLDVSDEASCARVVAAASEQLGPIDVLVNAAGVFGAGSVMDASTELWNHSLAVNLTGPFLLSRAAAADLIRQGGNVINISSFAGLGPVPNAAPYIASKHGLIGLTKSMAIDLALQGVRVNAICPGPTLTPMSEAFYARAPDPEEARRQRAKALPLGRMGRPEDIASVALHLASGAADWCTGVIYTADGGLSLGPVTR